MVGGEKRVSTYSYLNNGKLIIPNPDIENELEIVIKKYDELHNPTVIPKYVDEWIIRHRDIFDLYPALRRLESNSLTWEQVYKWYRENTHKFVNAYLTGEYEVEEEPITARDVIEKHIELLKRQGGKVNLKPYYDLLERVKNE